MKIKDEIAQLKKDMFSDEWRIALSASDRLAEIGGDDVIGFLIKTLKSSKISARNAAALTLQELKDERAKEPLIAAIKKPEFKNHIGTLLSALIVLDCSDLFEFLFQTALYGNYECQSKALMALGEKKFNINKTQITSAWNEIEKYCREYIDKPDEWKLLIDELKKMLQRVDKKSEDRLQKCKKQ